MIDVFFFVVDRDTTRQMEKRRTCVKCGKEVKTYLAEVSAVTSTGETSDGAGRLADTLGEGDLGLGGGDNDTTAGGSGGDIDSLFVHESMWKPGLDSAISPFAQVFPPNW